MTTFQKNDLENLLDWIKHLFEETAGETNNYTEI